MAVNKMEVRRTTSSWRPCVARMLGSPMEAGLANKWNRLIGARESSLLDTHNRCRCLTMKPTRKGELSGLKRVWRIRRLSFHTHWAFQFYIWLWSSLSSSSSAPTSGPPPRCPTSANPRPKISTASSTSSWSLTAWASSRRPIARCTVPRPICSDNSCESLK